MRSYGVITRSYRREREVIEEVIGEREGVGTRSYKSKRSYKSITRSYNEKL